MGSQTKIYNEAGELLYTSPACDALTAIMDARAAGLNLPEKLRCVTLIIADVEWRTPEQPRGNRC